MPTYGASTSKDELTELTKEQQKLKADIDEKAQAITDAQIEIDALNTTIESNQNEMDNLTAEVTEKQQDLDRQMTNFKSTLELLQRLSNNNALLSYVASSDNFLLKINNVMELSTMIDNNIQGVTADIESINKALSSTKSYQEQNKSNQEKSQALIDEQKKMEEQLRSQLQEVDSSVLTVTEQISVEEAAKNEAKQREQMEKEAAKAIEKANQKAENETQKQEPAVEEKEDEETSPVDVDTGGSSYPSNGNVSAYKNQLLSAAGISSSDMQYVDYIISKESGWNYLIANAYSGAYGLCQALPGSKMASSGSDWATNPETQMKWCNSYAQSRYGSWQGAYDFWIKNNWW